MQGDFFLTTWCLEGMRWLYANLDSVFLTIVISTVVLRALTVFSDIKTRKSSAKMAAVQPEINRLQKKYKDDPARAQKEQQKLMKERGVSMWGSCLPMLITMPLFFCFIAAFRFWGYEQMIRLLVEDNAEELFESFKFLWVNNIWQPDNGMTPVIMGAKEFLSLQNLEKLLYLENNPGVWDKLIDLGVAVRQFTASVSRDGTVVWTEACRFLATESAFANYDAAVLPFKNMYAGFNNGWFLLPLLAGGFNLISSLMMQKNQPQTAAAGQAAGTGKMMTWMFPIMSVVFCLSANAAFAIYWTLSSVLMIIINFILNKKFPRDAALVEEKK